MKRYASLIFSLLALSAMADDIQFTHGTWRVTYIENTHAFRLQGTLDGGSSYSPVVTNCIPEATYTDSKGQDHSITSTVSDAAYSATPISDDQFGTGTLHAFTFTSPDDGVKMTEQFYAYDNCDFLLVSVQVEADKELKSNYLAPIYTQSNYRILTQSSNNRMLKVPYDNDGFTRYHRYKLNTEMTSYEVSAIYSGDDRHGVVIGSIDHDHWKSAINVKGENNSNIARLKAFSGVSDSETRDALPHGKVAGSTVSSARFILDYSDDWRDGMERFAWANTQVVARNTSWQEGTPMGWQSWGVLAEKSNWTDVSEIAQYYADVLQPAGFCNAQGNVILSLDASDGLNDTQRKQLCADGTGRHQFVGCYSTPFSLWWGEGDKDSYVGTVNGVNYKVRDICIRQNGEPVRYDGAWALDPTHPKVKQDIVNFVNSAAAKGIRYIKCDFVNAGMIQSDSYYKAGITTAVEAYNEGMRYLCDRARAKGIFVALSIAPLFPYQYANSRRVACDTWGKIGHTEYAMNALCGGWWTSLLYQYNDPDHVVFIGTGDQLTNTEGENRARFTNAAATGMVLVADNFSTSNVSGRGVPSLSKKRAELVMTNSDVNEMADLGVSFRPLYGCKEYQNSEDKAENFVYYRTDRYLYLVGVNYGTTKMSGQISLSDLDLSDDSFTEIKELWTNTLLPLTSYLLPYEIPGRDARIYRFTLATGDSDSIHPTELSTSQTATHAPFTIEGRPCTEHSKGIIISDGKKTIVK